MSTGTSAPLRICLVVKHFPVLSQTFIVRLVAALLEDPSVELYLVVTRTLNDLHPLVAPEHRQRLQGRIIAPPALHGTGVSRVMAGARFVAGSFLRSPRLTLRSLNGVRFGPRARGLHILALARALRSLPPLDAIHGQFLWFAGDLAACRELGVTGNARLLCSVRGADIAVEGEVEPADLGRAARQQVLLLPVCRSLGQVALERGYPGSLLKVVPSGLAVEEIPFLPPSARPVSSVPEEVRLLFVGRLTRKKGFPLALTALAQLQEQGFSCSCSVLGEGPQRDACQEAARQAGLPGVSFRGAVPPAVVAKEMGQAHILLVPSQTGPDGDLEGIPNVAKEAMACGTIVVASTHSGLPELIRHGETGFLFAEGDATDLLDVLRQALARRDQWEQIARAAREEVVARHSTAVMREKLLRLYRDVSG
ncbi:hypothetical protein AU468_12360 [Alkalispirochaeta sphaeroplastigenens]|uniref:Glycosyl transferase family 1 domain-containing protein n=1 Tax=Alkalispirochaeta sphaeroplastigenens TaxID=1187066 RepID=A0A2S4JGW0_9SPIO|nr:glycosyltransferase [Alkalispirochaeta sphaeroplastigenens]POQ98650.1 hypothetical protein AU468_12360 [Alkalispirochaeta sphaeroplastigenens]